MCTQNKDSKRLATIVTILIAAIIFAIPAASGTNVSVVVVPDYELLEGEPFDVRIEIDDVENLDSGQFDLYFDSKVIDVVNVVDSDCTAAVESGSVGGTDVPIEGCTIDDYDEATIGSDGSSAGDHKIWVTFNLAGFDGVSGLGHLATITFEVTGKSGDRSVLNFRHDANTPNLVDTESEKINATWIDGNVAIGTSESDSTTTPPPTYTTKQKYDVSVYVKNLDDDSSDVHLLIDEGDRGYKTVSSGKTSPKYDKPAPRDYTLEEGTHTFMIRWFDTDTNKWYEKIEEHSITAATTIILQTDEHTEDEDELSAQVYVKNLDDDDQTVYLYLDGDYKKYMSIASNSTGYYDKYEFEDDEDTLHSFKIVWLDPKTNEEYQKITRSYITGEEAVTLYIDKHTKEDMILLSNEIPTPVSTPAQSTGNSQPYVRNTASSTTFHTDPAVPENSAGNNGSGPGITPLYILIGLLAVMFALVQIRRS
ncbi:MAG: cohesin domain-containing protein [Euryarchaeota archaeon]|nr:cohesin domain-containing protein [Euryarchaeota archaeon]